MKIYVLFIIFFSSYYCLAQQDVSGNWEGTSSFLNSYSKFTLGVSQNGGTIVGYYKARSFNGKDSIKAEFEGVINEHRITIKPTNLIYSSGLMCMSNLNLNFHVDGDDMMLTGKWSGDFKFTTCIPGTAGSIQLYKVRPLPPALIVAENAKEAHLLVDDDIGLALIKELSERKYYALIIGVNDYQDEYIQDLDNPVNDASKLADVLNQYYHFKSNEITILKNPKRENIIEALDNLIQKVHPKDNLLIFYAGHGIWNEQLQQGYWLPSDASMKSKSFWISNSTIRDYLGGINSKHTLLISDACFSGGILKERAVFENSRAILEQYKLLSRKAMTSGTMNTVPDKSVFLEYLIKNLVNNESPLMSADQLFRKFKTAVINNSPNNQVPQYGTISQAGDEGGDFIFLKKTN